MTKRLQSPWHPTLAVAVFLVAFAILLGCAQQPGVPGTPKAEFTGVDPDRCVRLGRVADALRLRLQNPVYLNGPEAALGQRALADAEFALALAGCVPEPVPAPE